MNYFYLYKFISQKIKTMKKIVMIATVAFLVTGIAFAQDTNKDKKTGGKECCKGKDCKKDKCDKKDMKDSKTKDVKKA